MRRAPVRARHPAPTGRKQVKSRNASGRKRRAAPPYLADEALALLLAQYEFDTVLDVGCGDGAHACVFRQQGKRVTTVSLEPYGACVPDFVGDILDFEPAERFDLVWCSHVLEHQPNVALFLQHLVRLAKPDGLLAITVPPARRTIVGGHLTVWNTGLLLYNLVVAGIDCSRARTKEYGYNVSVVVRTRAAALPPLRHDAGDIERLARYFPLPVKQGFDGRIAEIEWSQRRGVEPPTPEPASTLDPARFPAVSARCESDLDALLSLAAALKAAGHVLEFGVYRGRSIRALAGALPDRVIHGFDSFTGLPRAWKRSDASVYPAGHFGTGASPPVPANVQLWPGWFEDTVAPWLQAHAGPIALLHLDCDLYESAATVLAQLDARIVPGTIVVFDELCDWNESGVYSNWRAGEWRALEEWIAQHARTVRMLARGPHFSGAIEVVS